MGCCKSKNNIIDDEDESTRENLIHINEKKKRKSLLKRASLKIKNLKYKSKNNNKYNNNNNDHIFPTNGHKNTFDSNEINNKYNPPRLISLENYGEFLETNTNSNKINQQIISFDENKFGQHQYKTGWMKKKGHLRKNWKKRFFILNLGCLTYYSKEIDIPPFGQNLKGSIPLVGSKATFYSNKKKKSKYRIVITSPESDNGSKTLTVEFIELELATEWYEIILLEIDACNTDVLCKGRTPNDAISSWYLEKKEKYEESLKLIHGDHTFTLIAYDEQYLQDTEKPNLEILLWISFTTNDDNLDWQILYKNGKKKSNDKKIYDKIIPSDYFDRMQVMKLNDIWDVRILHYEDEFILATSEHRFGLRGKDADLVYEFITNLKIICSFLIIPQPRIKQYHRKKRSFN